jgi:density-regulated protein DRP1
MSEELETESGLETEQETVFALESLKLNLKDDDTTTDNIATVSFCNIDANQPVKVLYCPICSLPPEYCEYNVPEVFEKCAPWILENCPEALSKAIRAKLLGEELAEGDEDENEKSKKRLGVSKKKAAAAMVTRVVIAKIQRQKKKYVTAIAGLESVPDLKIKDACKAFGKKFSSGASISETQTGGKEVTIQGDCSYELPAFLISEFKVQANTIFFLEDGKLRPYV